MAEPMILFGFKFNNTTQVDKIKINFRKLRNFQNFGKGIKIEFKDNDERDKHKSLSEFYDKKSNMFLIPKENIVYDRMIIPS